MLSRGLIVLAAALLAHGDTRLIGFITPASFVDPWFAVATLAQSVAGRQGRDCGQHRDDRPLNEQWRHPIDNADGLRASLECVKKAQRDRVPFWTATGRTGIDAFGASGLLGTGDGEVRFFSVCLGGYCPYAIETHECVQPAIRNASGIAEFSCAG